jgi:hypothetical protein
MGASNMVFEDLFGITRHSSRQGGKCGKRAGAGIFWKIWGAVARRSPYMGDVFPQPWCGEKGKFFALLPAASLKLPIYGGARSAKCQEWASAMPGIPHPIPIFPQFFPFYPQIGGLYSLTLLPFDRLESRPTFIHYPSSPLSSVLCPDSFIRSPFVDGLPPQTGKPALLSSALLGQPSARRLSPRRPQSVPIRLFVPRFVDGLPPDEPESPSYGGLPSALRRLSHSVRPSAGSGVV